MAKCVLIVDDDPVQRRILEETVKKFGYATETAESGEDALAKLKTGIQPEVMLILSDINMPGMSGFDLLSEAKALWPDLPVAMITAYGDDESRRRALEAGATDFLTKPVDFDELKSKISDMIAARRS